MLLGIWHCSLKVGRLRTFASLTGWGGAKSNLFVVCANYYARPHRHPHLPGSRLEVVLHGHQPHVAFFEDYDDGLRLRLRLRLLEEPELGRPAHGTRNSQSLSCLRISRLNKAQANLLLSKLQRLGSQYKFPLLCPLRLL